jgi:hypothetical protein
MKRSIIVITAVLTSFCLGYLVRALYLRAPYTSESNVIHYCSCVSENTDAQRHLFEVADKVNRLIVADGEKLALQHNIFVADIQARLIIRENGNYDVVKWCSNRSSEVSRLEEEYFNMADSHIKLFNEALDEMHKTYHNAKNPKEAQSGPGE